MRDAVNLANITPGLDTITFSPSVFATPTTIALTTGSINVKDHVIIDASTAPGAITVSAGGLSFGVFNIDDTTPTTISATLRNLTISGGNSAGSGGGVFIADENVTLDACAVLANSATALGGGVFVSPSGSLTLRDTLLFGNSAGTSGGGVYADTASSVFIERSTLVGNVSTFGGGLATLGAPGAGGWTIRNSTLSLNQANVSGGAIAVNQFSGLLRIENSTVTQNSGGAGAIDDLAPLGGTIALASSIVNGNTGAFPEISVGGTSVVSAMNSWIFNTAGIATYVNLGGNLPFGMTPLAVPLQLNGGPTPTHALPLGSPAIDAGLNPLGLATDQRGPGFARQYGLAPDIGAFEVGPPPRVVNVLVNGGATQRSRVTSVDVYFDRPVGLGAAPFQLVRVSDSAAVTMSWAFGPPGPGTVATLTFTGGPLDAGSLADGRYTLTVLASAVMDGSFQQLDGNSDGIAGDNYVLTSSGASGVFRLFGDINGDAFTDLVDFVQYRLANGSDSTMVNYDPAFDVNGDGFIDNIDLIAFRQRLGVVI